GLDVAGTVVTTGAAVTRFKPGDEVFGISKGSFAEYAPARQDKLVSKPANLSLEQAAAVAVSGLTALQGLRDAGHLQQGQHVLINGASGGVGTFAVQIAKSLGAEVTGVCSTGNMAMVRSIGADHVIDYTKEDYTKGTQRYDVIIDTVGNHSLLDHRQVLKPDGIFVIVGAPSHDPWIGPLARFLNGYAISPFVSQKFVSFIADANRTDDLNTLRDLMQAGKVIPVIDRQYSLSEAPAAMRYLEKGHARGKVVISLE